MDHQAVDSTTTGSRPEVKITRRTTRIEADPNILNTVLASTKAAQELLEQISALGADASKEP